MKQREYHEVNEDEFVLILQFRHWSLCRCKSISFSSIYLIRFPNIFVVSTLLSINYLKWVGDSFHRSLPACFLSSNEETKFQPFCQSGSRFFIYSCSCQIKVLTLRSKFSERKRLTWLFHSDFLLFCLFFIANKWILWYTSTY